MNMLTELCTIRLVFNLAHDIPQVCYARVLDFRRKFIEAAQRYIDLSYRTAIHDDERMTALKHALICTMLASAGM